MAAQVPPLRGHFHLRGPCDGSTDGVIFSSSGRMLLPTEPRMASPTFTFDLVRRFKNGDNGAFSQLFQLYHRRLAVSVYFRMSAELRALHEVDDIVQEVFLRASRDMNQFTYHSPGSFMAWLLCIADRVVVD